MVLYFLTSINHCPILTSYFQLVSSIVVCIFFSNFSSEGPLAAHKPDLTYLFYSISVCAEVLVERLHHGAAILIAIVHLDASVLITDELLDIDATLPSHAQHDAALVRKAFIGDLWLLNLEILALLGLVGAHFVLSLKRGNKLLQVLVRWHCELMDIALEERAGLRLAHDRHGLVDHL